MDIKMTKFASLKSLCTVYSTEKNEWFWNYKLSLLSGVLTVICLFFWLLFGQFSGFGFVFTALELVLLAHILLSVLAVINDYVFDVFLKECFKGLWILISLRVMVEVLIF